MVWTYCSACGRRTEWAVSCSECGSDNRLYQAFLTDEAPDQIQAEARQAGAVSRQPGSSWKPWVYFAALLLVLLIALSLIVAIPALLF